MNPAPVFAPLKFVRGRGNTAKRGLSSAPTSGSTEKGKKPAKLKEDEDKKCATPSLGDGPRAKQFRKEVESSGTARKSPGSHLKRIGKYRRGPIIGVAPVKSIQIFLGRAEGSNQFVVLKVLTLKGEGVAQTTDDIQGKVLLHTEHSTLSRLRGVEGVLKEYGMFRHTTEEEHVAPDGTTSLKKVEQIVLAVDCYISHDFHPKYTKLTTLQHYVIAKKRIGESEAVRIFYRVLLIVERLHKLNVVHRDLKLGNFVLNKGTQEVILSNFCLAKYLPSENILLTDQRGSPAYISPDVISGKPYLGKPSDMWALGVVLYTMLYGQFPFYSSVPSELFSKIKTGEFQVNPSGEVNVTPRTVGLVKSLLTLDPSKRITCPEALNVVKSIIEEEQYLMGSDDEDDHAVPVAREDLFRYNFDDPKEVARMFADFTSLVSITERFLAREARLAAQGEATTDPMFASPFRTRHIRGPTPPQGDDSNQAQASTSPSRELGDDRLVPVATKDTSARRKKKVDPSARDEVSGTRKRPKDRASQPTKTKQLVGKAKQVCRRVQAQKGRMNSSP